MSDPAGGFVCHARGRGRPIRDACRKGVKRRRKEVTESAARGALIRGDASGNDARWRDFVKRQTICAVFAMLAFAAPATVFAQAH